MDTLPIHDDLASPTAESGADRQRRIAREAEGIAQARASAAAGRVVDFSRVEAWIDSLDTDHELSVPTSGR